MGSRRQFPLLFRDSGGYIMHESPKRYMNRVGLDLHSVIFVYSQAVASIRGVINLLFTLFSYQRPSHSSVLR